MKVSIYNDAISDPESHVLEIKEEGFVDVQLGKDLFKNVQAKETDKMSMFLNEKYPLYSVALNFARKSPLNQIEPNYIHTDEMMGDLTAVLYLNKNPDSRDGTTIYLGEEGKRVIKSKFNKMVVFPSHLEHSRNILENYGEGDDARLIQVVFLKKI